MRTAESILRPGDLVERPFLDRVDLIVSCSGDEAAALIPSGKVIKYDYAPRWRFHSTKKEKR